MQFGNSEWASRIKMAEAEFKQQIAGKRSVEERKAKKVSEKFGELNRSS
jgi:hypothetical protein